MKINNEKEKLLTQAQLKESLSYRKETGEFTWIVEPLKHHTNKVGHLAGSLTTGGYITISIDGGRYLAHRLAWLYVYGYFPKGDKCFIDHIDQNRSNNRIENLREVSQAENARNQKMYSNNKSSVTGVYLRKKLTKKVIYEYFVAAWYNKNGEKLEEWFSVKKYGFDQAKTLATAFRERQLYLLKAQGVSYSDLHGV